MGTIRDELLKLSIDSRSFEQGELWTSEGKYISAGLRQYFGWSEKDVRIVLIVQNDDGNNQPLSPIILVAPITSTSKPTTLDIVVKAGEGNLDKESVIQISLIQPVPKSILTKRIGKISDNCLEIVKMRILQKFGLVPIEIEENI